LWQYFPKIRKNHEKIKKETVSHKRKMSTNKRGKIVGATWRCVLQVLGQQAFCWSLLGDYDISVKYTVTTLIAGDAILERAIKQGLSLFFCVA